MRAAFDTVEYYLLRDGGFIKFEWEGPDPSYVVVAPLEDALREMGVFDVDPSGLWPAEVGTAWFVVPAGAAGDLAAVFADTPWVDFLTAGRIRDSLGVSDDHAAALVELTLVESARLTEILRAADAHDADLLCVVY